MGKEVVSGGRGAREGGWARISHLGAVDSWGWIILCCEVPVLFIVGC